MNIHACIRPYTLLVLSATIYFSSNALLQAQGATDELRLPTASDKPATLSFDELRKGITARYARLKAIDVEYVQATTNLTLNKPVLPKVEYHYAYKGEQRLKGQKLGDKSSSKDPLLYEDAWAFDGKSYQNRSLTRRQGRIEPTKEPYLDVDSYMEALQIPVSDQDRASVGMSPKFLPFSLDIEGFEWSVRPLLENVDDYECHVLESRIGMRLWIDSAAGYAVRFREARQPLPNKPPEAWPLLTRYAFRELAEVEPGLWLPRKTEINGFVSPREPENQWNKISYRTAHQVTSLTVNDKVSDSIFTLTYPPGTTVFDDVESRIYRIGKTKDELDSLVAQGHAKLSWLSARTLFIIANLVVVVALAILFAYSRMRSKHGQSSN